MAHITINLKKQQHGTALFIVVLIILLVLTLVAVTAMRSTNLEVRMARNDNLLMNALGTSEGPRSLSGDMLDDHIFDRGWDSITTPAGLKVIPSGSSITIGASDDASSYCVNTSGTWSCTAADLYSSADISSGDTSGELLGGSDNLGKHIVYSFASGVGESKISINKIGQKLAIGSSAAMISGYEGTGKASAANGAHMYFDIRSVGRFNEARVTTGTDYRIVIRN